MSDKQFLVVGFSLIDNDKYREIMTSNKGIEMTYQWLRRNIIRAPMRNAYCREVFDQYFMKGELAATANEKELADKLFISNNTLRKNVEILENNGFIKVGRLNAKPGGSAQHAQKVYRLGKWLSEIDLQGNEKVVEFLYIFDILTEDITAIR